MGKKHPRADRNFDDLSRRFGKNIYQTMKGQLRLAVLRRDLIDWVPEGQALQVLDVGAGQGHWALELTRMGHQVLLTDISAGMLQEAQSLFAEAGLSPSALAATKWLQAPVHELPARLPRTFDMVVCHAVLEWLAEPQKALAHLASVARPNGWLSLIFYNVDGLIFKNLLRTNYKKVLQSDFTGARGSLTPVNPLHPSEVLTWLDEAGFELVCQSGIRVFHDYILDPLARARDAEQVIQLELAYSRRAPYRDLGRYIHILARRRPDRPTPSTGSVFD